VKTADEVLSQAIWECLGEVMDPEIPAVSVVEMGMIRSIELRADHAHVTVLPTFTGCPAIPIIKQDVEQAIRAVPGVQDVEVEFAFDPPWTPDRITSEGRRKLKEFGLAPPTGTGPVLISEIGLPKVAECPFCGSKNTRNESLFGPTPCRAVYYCAECRNPFEQFKAV
jgi:ring-1,2-phenylacetyl-CoA epoxidase subunit PaaD